MKTFIGKNAFSNVTKDVHKNMVTAAINTVNICAAQSRKNAVEIVSRKFILRSTFTVKNIRYDQSKKVKNMEDAVAYVGATTDAAYMSRLESGGTRKNSSGGLNIPMTAARRGSTKNKVSNSMYWSKIKSRVVTGSSGQTKRFHSHKANFVAMAAVAAKTQGFIEKNKIVYKVSNFSASGNVRFKLTPLYNERFETTRTPAFHWLTESCDTSSSKIQSVFNSEMDKLK